jgi:hypothetical protein
MRLLKGYIYDIRKNKSKQMWSVLKAMINELVYFIIRLRFNVRYIRVILSTEALDM